MSSFGQNQETNICLINSQQNYNESTNYVLQMER